MSAEQSIICIYYYSLTTPYTGHLSFLQLFNCCNGDMKSEDCGACKSSKLLIRVARQPPRKSGSFHSPTSSVHPSHSSNFYLTFT